MTRSRHMTTLGILGVAVLAVSAAGAAETITYTATTTVPGASPRASTVMVTLSLDRFSTEEERDALTRALVEGGQQGLLEAARANRVGNLRRVGDLGVNVVFAKQVETPQGTRVAFVAERWVTFGELYTGSRSTKYPFVVGWFTLDENGKGDGALYAATEISFDEATRTVEVENLGAEQMRLLNVRKR
ncbi:MAG: hypothetical protein ACOY3Y_12800 [Acidobacteriota bacterium]